jgi:hypothetical protein
MDGIEATRQIRALGGCYGNLPIIAMTANVLIDQVVQYLAAGMTDHIAKPIDTRRLLQVLAKWTLGAALPADTPRFEWDVWTAQDAHDPAVWNELVEMLGRERVQGFAETLRAALLQDWAEDACRGTKTLAAAAHACVALSGQLGFGALSAASRKLEGACLEESGVQSALDALGLARLDALIALERLLTDPACDAPAAHSEAAPALHAVTA